MSTQPAEITYREAVREAIREAMSEDDRVFIMGEDVADYGGTYAVTMGLLEEFGPDRVRNTPLCESGFVGAGIGAAVGGMRPIVEIMTVNFSLLALDQIVNTAATLRHMSGGQIGVPLVIRLTTGAGRQLAAQHSHSLEGWFAHVPGLKVVAPASVHDARWMLGAALRDPDPVIIFEHSSLYNTTGPVGQGPVNLSGASVLTEGTDLTLIASAGMVRKAVEAARQLELNGISAEVIDLRSLRPLDRSTLRHSVERTNRALVVDEGWRTVGLSAEIAAFLAEDCFYSLDAPVGRLATAEVPIPYPKHLEDAAIPQVADIVSAAGAVVAGGLASRPVAKVGPDVAAETIDQHVGVSSCRLLARTWTTGPSSSGSLRRVTLFPRATSSPAWTPRSQTWTWRSGAAAPSPNAWWRKEEKSRWEPRSWLSAGPAAAALARHLMRQSDPEPSIGPAQSDVRCPGLTTGSSAGCEAAGIDLRTVGGSGPWRRRRRAGPHTNEARGGATTVGTGSDAEGHRGTYGPGQPGDPPLPPPDSTWTSRTPCNWLERRNERRPAPTTNTAGRPLHCGDCSGGKDPTGAQRVLDRRTGFNPLGESTWRWRCPCAAADCSRRSFRMRTTGPSPEIMEALRGDRERGAARIPQKQLDGGRQHHRDQPGRQRGRCGARSRFPASGRPGGVRAHSSACPGWLTGSCEVRPVVTVTLSADHRATDGATGSRFLASLAAYLQKPEESWIT